MIRLSSFALAALLFILPAAEAADVASRAWLTTEQYQKEFDALTAQGYRPIAVDAYATPQGILYAGLWLKSSSTRPYIARHNMTIQQFQKEFDTASAQGFRLVDISVADGGVFAGIWEKGDGPAWEARAGLDIAAFAKKYTEMSNAGFRLIDFEGYQDAGGVRFAGIWQKNDGRAWTAWADMTTAQYQAHFDEMAAKGYWPVHVDGYLTPNGVRYAAIFEQGPGNVVARHDMTQAQLQQAYNELTAQGYTIAEISGYSDGSQPLYAALWTK